MKEMTPQKRRNIMNRRQWILRVSSGIVGAAAISGISMCIPSEVPVAVPADFEDDEDVDYPEAVNVPCVGCSYCMPCSFGVDIPRVLAFFNRAVEEDFLPDMTQAFDNQQLLEQARTFIERYDSELGDKHQAHRCIQCHSCDNSCPQGIEIVKELARITALTERLRDIICAYD
jgi:ferredoxin